MSQELDLSALPASTQAALAKSFGGCYLIADSGGELNAVSISALRKAGFDEYDIDRVEASLSARGAFLVPKPAQTPAPADEALNERAAAMQRMAKQWRHRPI